MANVTNKIFVDKMGGRPATSYIGQPGEIFYDPAVGDLRLSDGATAGGKSLLSSQDSGTYRGFQAGCNQFLNNTETNIAQIVIHNAEEKVDYIKYTGNKTNRDDFYVTSLNEGQGGSSANTVVLLNVYSNDTNNRETLLTIDLLRAFVRKFVDLVLYDDNDERRTDINDMKEAFYDNSKELNSVFPTGTLYPNFGFEDGFRITDPEYVWPETNTNPENYTAGFRVTVNADNFSSLYDDNASVTFYDSGEGFEVGDVIIVPGQQMYGIDGEHDLTLTVTELKSGHIKSLQMTNPGSDIIPQERDNSYSIGGEVGGTGASIRVISCTSSGAIEQWEMVNDGQNYQVGDTLILNTGGTSAQFEVIEIGTDGISDWTVSGTAYRGSPHRVSNGYWPEYFIQDGGEDQYDTANFISSDKSTSSYIADFYNGKMTLGNGIKIGIDLESGMYGMIRYADGDFNTFRLISQATDNSNVWYITGEGISDEGATVRFDSIPYGAGDVINSNGNGPFGFGSSYCTVYEDSIWGMIITDNSSNSIYYNGNHGADGNGYAQQSVLMGETGTNQTSVQIPQIKVDQDEYTLKSSAAGSHIYYNNGGDNTVRVPTEAHELFPVGTAITIVSGTDGRTYIDPQDSDITRIYGAGFDEYNVAWYIPANSMATLLKIATDRWMLSGAGLGID
jgi:hypothetical protein